MRSDEDRSVLFVCPDYHCSFLYRDQLRLRGWKADVYVPPRYPKELLYDTPDMKALSFASNNVFSLIAMQASSLFCFIKALSRYRYHIYYGRLDHFSFLENRIPILRRIIGGFRLHLAITKLIGCKVIYVPSGTPDEVDVETILTLGNAEEGVLPESKHTNRSHLSSVRRYSDLNVGFGFVHTREFEQTHFQYKALDLDRWRPEVNVPPHYRLARPRGGTVRILHSFMYGADRQKAQRGNIKGTRYVVEAVEQLQSEGFDVELMSFDRVSSKDYIYYQAQADIIVEELIRGCWGSTALECMALGKPVLTFIRPEWERAYLRAFPWVTRLPVVNTSKYSIYTNLKRLIEDTGLREKAGVVARHFAEQNLDVTKNVKTLESVILSIEHK